MSTQKMICRILVIFCVCTAIISLYAQEETTPMYLDDKGGELEGETIYTGKVIAYGELLEPPYIVELKNDTIWINEVPYSPVKQKGSQKWDKQGEDESWVHKHNLMQELNNKYEEYTIEHGEDSAKTIIKADYKDHPLISELELSESGQSLIVEFEDGKQIFLDLSPIEEKSIGSKEKTELRRSQVEKLRKRLKENMMVIFSYEQPYHYILPHKVAEIEKIISDMKGGLISKSVAEEELSKLITKEHAIEILNNLDEWR